MRRLGTMSWTIGVCNFLCSVMLTMAGLDRADAQRPEREPKVSAEDAHRADPKLQALGAGHTFEILPSHTIGQCFDVEGAKLTPADVYQYTCHGGANQRFTVAYVGAGEYEIRALHSGLCLDISGASFDDGASLIQWPCNGQTNQRFRINATPSGAYEIRAVHSDKCLDVPWELTTPGVRIQQFQCHGSANQQFYFQP